MNYRPDIDVLRAIAVLSVVFFHLDIPGFQGGFVGVDIFFVISGYLITSIIKDKYENHKFKLSDFYVRRIRRLVPPLIATTAATLIAASFVMLPYNMMEFARSATAALFSLSNIVFYMESGYWDSASELKPLLHTWSLGVEEQFYLFWPALIVGLLTIRRYVTFGTSLALISLFGAALYIWYANIDDSATFYLLPFRVFQFSVGAWLLPLTSSIKGNVKSYPIWLPALTLWSGIFCITVSVIALGDNTIFSGWSILVPTIGAALFLLSGALPGRLDFPGRALTQSPLGIWLGGVSYSMYLVHWPLIALFRYQYGLELTVEDQLLLVAVTLLATCALHYGIERRFYTRQTQSAKQATASSDTRFVMNTVFVAGLLALISSSAWLRDGWTWRFPLQTLSTEQIKKGGRSWLDRNKYACGLMDFASNPACNVDAEIQILVLGDSHRVDAYNFIKAGYGHDKNVNLIIFKYPNDCSKFFSKNRYSPLENTNEECQRLLDKLFVSAVIPHLNIVVYASKFPYTGRLYLAMIQKLKETNPEIQIVTFGGYIHTKRPCFYYINRARNSDACALPGNISYFAGDREEGRLIKEYKEIESYYIDRVDLLCKSFVPETCLTRTDNGIPMLYDTDHNSVEFSEMSGKMYAKKYPDFLHNLTGH